MGYSVSLIEKAKNFAIQAHGSQKYGEHPYSYHLGKVAEIVKAYSEEIQATAWLHDVIEDTPITLDEISSEFGFIISEAVALLSDQPGDNRKERKQKTYALLSQVDTNSNQAIALIVKAADRLANLRECLKTQHKRLLDVYIDEHQAIRSAICRPGLCDEIWEKIDNIVESSQQGK